MALLNKYTTAVNRDDNDSGAKSSTTKNNTVSYVPTAAPSGYVPTAAPELSAAPGGPSFDTTKWDSTAKGQAAANAYEAAKEAIKNYKDFEFSENAWLEDVKEGIRNYEDFTYDVNSDALYQQYADQYVRQGKMASANVMGQAAAMTGGYGNSYMATVGNQAYQSYLQELNDKVPELYQLALDRHQMGKEDLYKQYSMLLSEFEREYGLYSDEYNKLLDYLGITKDDYYMGADLFHTEQSIANDAAYKGFDAAMRQWEANNENAWRQAEWEENANRYAYEDSWKQAEWEENNNRYANENEWKQKDYDLSDRQVSLQEKQYEDSKKTVNNNNNNSNASAIPDNIRQKAGTFTNNDALNDYLTKQRDAGLITDEQMGQLYLENEVSSLSNRNWTAGKNGGINWFGGIDNNATVKDQYGNEYSLDKLVDALVADGMSKSEAKEYVKKLQGKLGL